MIVEGVVVGHRKVTIPAREAEQYVDRVGKEKISRPQPEQTYTEIGVSCPALLDGEDGGREVHPDVTALMSVRWPDRKAVPGVGDVVRWAVEHSVMKVFIRGQFREWVVVHYRGLAPAVPSAAFAVAGKS